MKGYTHTHTHTQSNFIKHKWFEIVLFTIVMITIFYTRVDVTNQKKELQEIKEPLKMQETNLQTEEVQPRLLAATAADNNKYVTMAEMKSSMLTMYPVGAIYLSTSSTNPSNFIGGTWVAYGQGRTLVGVGSSDKAFTINETGGEPTHKLTIAEMPSHTHSIYGWNSSANGALPEQGSWNWTGHVPSDWSRNDIVSSTGGNGAHNNLQPYIVCYMWKRTA